VVGFDDSPIASRMRPQLTTVRQDSDAKGRAAGSAVITALTAVAEGRTVRPRTSVLPTSLVVRSTTARPKGKARR
jgi:DNA-binding LacI/PurR family transcriptional regulator